MSEIIPSIVVDKPKRSNFNLSFTNRFDCSPGLLYPVLVRDHYPADEISLDMASIIKTMPTIGPMFGSFKVQFDAYFIPTRLYINVLHNNMTDFDPADVKFPIMRLWQRPEATENVDPDYLGVHQSSIFHFLGIPGNFFLPQSEPAARQFNAIPLLGYWDIFKNYYANTQEDKAYFMGLKTTTVSEYLTPVAFDLSNIDDKRYDILANDSLTRAYPVVATGANQTDPFKFTRDASPSSSSVYDYHYAKGGLALRTYLPDRFSVWIDANKYTISLNSAVIDVSSGSFNMDQLRFANKLNEMLQKTLVSGGRFSDWQRVQYGTSAIPLMESPIFIGSRSTELSFEDIMQTSSSPQAGSDNYNPSTDPYTLGSMAAVGRGFLSGKRMKYYCNELGYLMVIMSVVPRVDYSQGTRDCLTHLTLGDLHVPALDSIGMQDLLVDTFFSAGCASDGSFNVEAKSVGKQPAWLELMTSVNETHGNFAAWCNLSYMALNRTFMLTSNFASGIDFTAYVDPVLYLKNFAGSDYTADPFWVQIRFQYFVKRALSKRVMPNL